MQIASFLQKFGRDVVYLSIIGGLVGWIWVDGKRQEVWNELLRRDIQISQNLLQNMTEHILGQISKNSDEFQDENRARAVSKNAAAATKCADEFIAHVMKLNDSLWAQDIEKPHSVNRSINQNELEKLRSEARMLFDSLQAYSMEDKDFIYIINGLLGQDSLETIWKIGKTLKTNQTPAYLQCLIFEAKILTINVLRHLDSKLEKSWDCFPAWMPIVSSKSSTLRPGETYSAEIYLGQYSRSRNVGRNTTIKINGKPFPIKDGLAQFSQRYTSPGEKKLKVEIDIKNPLTKEITHFKKEFALLVVDSCH